MEKQYAPSSKDKKVSSKVVTPVSAPVNTEAKIEDIKVETEKKTESSEVKTEKKEEKKKIEVKITPKENAIVRGNSLPISPKYSYSICKMIKGKTPDQAIARLELVCLKKIAVPMNNMEIPHRHGDILAGRYPITAAKAFIDLLKQAKANASVNSVENAVIFLAKADRASRPYRRGGMRAKRANVYIELRDKTKMIAKKMRGKK